jgi:hypothetical protein
MSGTKCPVSGTNQLVPDKMSGTLGYLFSGLMILSIEFDSISGTLHTPGDRPVIELVNNEDEYNLLNGDSLNENEIVIGKSC